MSPPASPARPRWRCWAKGGDNAFDIILMDLQMPTLSGVETTQRIRKQPGLKRIPIVALTAGAMKEDRESALQAGMDDFMTKPFEPAQLVQVLRAHVQRYRHALLPIQKAPPPLTDEPTFPDISGIDTGQAQQRLQGDRTFFCELLTSFRNEHREGVAHLRALLAEQRNNDAARYLHRLRGQAGNFAATTLMDAARDLEQQIRANSQQLEAAISAFASALETLLQGAAPWLTTQSPAPSSEPLSEDELVQQLGMLREKLLQNSVASVQIVDAINIGLSDQATISAFQAVSEATKKLKFADALNALSNFEVTIFAGK